MCALTDTLILDEDRLYDPAHFNDRLLLGLKGTMSEIAEQLGVALATMNNWNQAGFLRSHLYNDRNDCFFEPMGDDTPVKGKHKGLTASRRQLRRS
jgi:hypothetical protein